MNRTKTLASTLSLVALAYACTDKPTPSATDVVVPEPAQAISDALHSGGNSGFFFLPPMVPDPAHDGTFAAALSPVVRICEWAGTACVIPFVAEFTTETGPGSETVRLSTDDEHYIVSWHTDEFDIFPVLVAGTELGFADVQLGRLTFESLSGGLWHTCGVVTSGAAYCWGWNQVGMLGNGDGGSRSQLFQT